MAPGVSERCDDRFLGDLDPRCDRKCCDRPGPPLALTSPAATPRLSRGASRTTRSRTQAAPGRDSPRARPRGAPLTDTTPIIETSALTRRFGDLIAVDRVDLAVPRGCFYGFLGPNGAGKSTTIKMLTGLLAPSGGKVRVLGGNIADPAQAIVIKRRLGVVPENLALYDNLTAREYLTFIGRMHELAPEVVAKRSGELLDVMELASEEKKLTLEYSHGMRKKLALAAAMIHDPELLFLDEPFEGVDAISSRMLREVLRRSVERGATIFLTSHVLEIVEKLCTHVGIIAKGRIVHQGPLAELQRGRSLEDRFLEVAGGAAAETPHRLSWLEE